jgi:hypothetical protein
MKKVEDADTLARLKEIAGQWLLDVLLDHELFTKGGRRNKSKMGRVVAARLEELFERWRLGLGEDFMR